MSVMVLLVSNSIDLPIVCWPEFPENPHACFLLHDQVRKEWIVLISLCPVGCTMFKL
uniref:Uncharacterized protein n=1 Tax=Arundo donax TaxID=35708 RepID=A0A0A8ZWA0_ARUDO